MIATNARRQPAEVRREQILQAAEAVMLRDGLHQATIADIADAAGLGKGTVYLQFDSKQDLVAGLRRRYVDQIEAEVVGHISKADSPAGRLSAFVESFIAASTRHLELHHLLFQEAGADEGEAFAPLRALFAGVVVAAVTQPAPLELVIDYALGGIHAGAIAVAHMPKNRRRAGIAAVVALAHRTVGA